MAPTAAVIGLAAPLTLFLAGCNSGDDAPNETIAQIAVGTKDLSTLVAALTATDLVSVLNGTDKYTVFAPTNAAFDQLPKEVFDCLLEPVGLPVLSDVLKYHVVADEAEASDLKNDESLKTLDGDNTLTVSIAGSNVTIEGGSSKAGVVQADIMATNGVVHEVNAVLLPKDFAAPECGTGTITATAAGNADLKTLVAALGAANLTDTFDGSTVYTVFAPTNAAFTALGDTVDCLLKPENVDALTTVLTYHVVAGYDLSSAIKNGLKLTTLEKEDITFFTAGGNVTIEPTSKSANATVITPDVYANNGVVHVIDAVLLPKDFMDNNPCGSKTIADATSSAIVV
jgi:uncharacterized surface protein with fasciclin (FAS1) repeats